MGQERVGGLKAENQYSFNSFKSLAAKPIIIMYLSLKGENQREKQLLCKNSTVKGIRLHSKVTDIANEANLTH